MKTYPLPIYVQRFFTERLATQLHASPNTVASYRDTFRLLLKYAADRLRRAADPASDRRYRRGPGRRLPDLRRDQARQWRAQPQHAPVGDPLVLQVCRRQ